MKKGVFAEKMIGSRGRRVGIEEELGCDHNILHTQNYQIISVLKLKFLIKNLKLIMTSGKIIEVSCFANFG